MEHNKEIVDNKERGENQLLFKLELIEHINEKV
jgi:hypothetical protein